MDWARRPAARGLAAAGPQGRNWRGRGRRGGGGGRAGAGQAVLAPPAPPIDPARAGPRKEEGGAAAHGARKKERSGTEPTRC